MLNLNRIKLLILKRKTKKLIDKKSILKIDKKSLKPKAS